MLEAETDSEDEVLSKRSSSPRSPRSPASPATPESPPTPPAPKPVPPPPKPDPIPAKQSQRSSFGESNNYDEDFEEDFEECFFCLRPLLLSLVNEVFVEICIVLNGESAVVFSISRAFTSLLFD